MPEVRRGSRTDVASVSPTAIRPSAEAQLRPTLELNQQPSHQSTNTQNKSLDTTRTLSPTNTQSHEVAVTSQSPGRNGALAFRTDSNEPPQSPHTSTRDRRSSFVRNSSETRPEADVYYDSRAATKREWRRRPTTLQQYYHENPELLPQLPFTFHRGKKRWRLITLISLMWIDACVLPIALYYGMYYGGDVQGWIIFAVVTTIWGGPTYLEYALRTFKLMKKEKFYRPLGTNYRWCFDYLTWASAITIFVVTTLFIVGSAPHEVWLRVLCMPMPGLLYCLGILCGLPTLYHHMGWKAPFRLSSTNKGEVPRPGVYYFVEDTVAVNANAGRPYREALNARYEVSPRFRQMMYVQSVFWSVPAVIIAIPLTVISVISPVKPTVAYAISK